MIGPFDQRLQLPTDIPLKVRSSSLGTTAADLIQADIDQIDSATAGASPFARLLAPPCAAVDQRPVQPPTARRSQSCRVTGEARQCVRRRNHHSGDGQRSPAGSCASLGEPVSQDLTDDGGRRRRRRRRPQQPRLSVSSPDRNAAAGDVRRHRDEDAEAYRLRNFSLTPKGFVNQGDSFRIRRTSSAVAGCRQLHASDSCLATSSATAEQLQQLADQQQPPAVPSYTVFLLGASGVGKTTLVTQLMTSECINAYDDECHGDGELETRTVCVELEGQEAELRLVILSSTQRCDLTLPGRPDAVLVIYSVADRASFERAQQELSLVSTPGLCDAGEATSPRQQRICRVLVANKVDLVRGRVVKESEGVSVACEHNAKFIEISVGMNHNCDELLVGVLHQIRLLRPGGGMLPRRLSCGRRELNGGESDVSSTSAQLQQPQHVWTRSRSLARASRKCRRVLTRVFGGDEAQRKKVTNFQVHN